MNEISLYDLMESVANDRSTEDKPSNDNKDSKESKPSHMITGNKDQQKTLFDKLKEVPAKADTISKNFKLWARKSKNLLFYRKYLDRVNGGLYDRYGSEARITENQMVDDPVTILSGPAQKYIQAIVADINKLYQEVVTISKSLENKVRAEDAIACVAKYCKTAITETGSGSRVDADKQSWKDKILNSTKYKIGNILLSHRDTRVYGYTVKNIVLKGYPKPNHLIVTLFVENPEERPTEQSVTDVFKSANSFDILADANKRDIFNVSAMTTAILSKTVDNKVMNDIKLLKNNTLAAFKNANIENKHDEAKIIDSIWNGINASCRELLTRKAYLIDCINVYYDMILRIDKLAVKAIKQMLDVEDAHRDTRYDKHSNLSHKNNKFFANAKNNRYADDVYLNKNNTSGNETSANRARSLRETAKALNNPKFRRQVN